MFNQQITVSRNTLPLYEGEMTLLAHQGEPCAGTGSIELAAGRAMRHLRVSFTANGALPSLSASASGEFGRGTAFARIPGSPPFFVFVTSGGSNHTLVGESQLVISRPDRFCERFNIYLLNALIPESAIEWSVDEWNLRIRPTECAYGLARVSLPEHEINLTRVVEVRRTDAKPFTWAELDPFLARILAFASFANGSLVPAPVAFGYSDEGAVDFYRFETPPRTIPTNRRSWATGIEPGALEDALRRFVSTTETAFWMSILDRAIQWHALAEAALYDSTDEALFVLQMLLEMLAYVVLVEEAQMLGEDGYGKLPASDRITLLCGQTGQPISLPNSQQDLQAFCSANSIRNVGELIATLRNKLVHPTKKNREYLERVPSGVRMVAVTAGFQIAMLAILKILGYSREYYDTIRYERRTVPWG